MATRSGGLVERRETVASDGVVFEVARHQHGVVTGAQLQGLGLDQSAIARRVAQGRLRRLHRGVFLVGPIEAELTAPTAAVLACGEGAVLGGRTAAAIWGLIDRRGSTIDVLTTRRARSRPGIRIHRTSSLDARDVTRHQGIPITRPARTLLDLAVTASAAELDRAIEQAQILHRVAPERAVERLSGQRGAVKLRAALRRNREPRLTRSEAERRLLALVRHASLPAPATNVRIEGLEVDLLWRPQRLVVEVDGFAFHGTRAAFERDRRRDARLQTAGYRVVRLTWRRITDEPLAVAAQLAVLLR